MAFHVNLHFCPKRNVWPPGLLVLQYCIGIGIANTFLKYW